MLLPQYTCIVLDIIFENRLSFLQVQRHESICILHGHLLIEGVHGSVLDQIGHAFGKVLKSFRIGGRVRLLRERAVPGLVHVVNTLQFIVDTCDSQLALGSRSRLLR